MTITLDKTRPYAEVYGQSVSHRFEQDGKLFGADGVELMACQEEPAVEVNVIETDLPEQITPENTRRRRPKR